MHNTETTELVRAFRAGDAQAFNRLVLMYQARVYNLAFNYVKQQEEAKDLTQDIFVTIYRSLPKLKDETKFPAWLYQIALNHCRNRYRKLQRRGFFSSQSIDDPDSFIQLADENGPENNLEKEATIQLVRSTIASMPDAEKEVLVLRDLQELSYEEISEILQVPLGTVKSKLNRARIALKNRLKHVFQQ